LTGGLAPGRPHFPGVAPIEAYGRGGFRFAGMSHRGSLMCLPSGVWGWDVSDPQGITEAALEPVFAEANALSLFLIGTGDTPWTMPDALRWRFQERRISLEIALTGRAANTYNILLDEGRRVGAALIAAA
jgi:uncharacterized protein